MSNATLKHSLVFWVSLCSLLVLLTNAGGASCDQTIDSPSKSQKPKTIAYTNRRYGFQFYLPESWKGYSISLSEWQGGDGKTYQPGEIMPPPKKGLLINPTSPFDTDNPRQDFGNDCCEGGVEVSGNGQMILSAGPAGPYELGATQNTYSLFRHDLTLRGQMAGKKSTK
jgi:hypothetical protein